MQSLSTGCPEERNLVLNQQRDCLNGSQTLFIHANYELQIIDAIKLAKKSGIKIVIVGGFEAYKTADLLKENNRSFIKTFTTCPENDQDIDLPYKMASLVDKGLVVGLENSGDMNGMNTRNLPFLAGTCAASMD
jgi:hypothetical protein